MSVRGNGAEGTVVEIEQQAVQVIADILVGHGKSGLVEQVCLGDPTNVCASDIYGKQRVCVRVIREVG